VASRLRNQNEILIEKSDEAPFSTKKFQKTQISSRIRRFTRREAIQLKTKFALANLSKSYFALANLMRSRSDSTSS
jgi:hypothetical protein